MMITILVVVSVIFLDIFDSVGMSPIFSSGFGAGSL
jgi:hypothetical protein